MKTQNSKTLEDIAADQQVDQSPLLRYLDECEKIVEKWPEWKKTSLKNAFQIPKTQGE